MFGSEKYIIIFFLLLYSMALLVIMQYLWMEKWHQIQHDFQKERQDMLDRLMAKDLTEAKMAQKIVQSTDKKTVSKLSNTKKKMKETIELGGSDK